MSRYNKFTGAIDLIKSKMPPTHKSLANDTPCFGELWIMDNTVCPELDCDLRSFCQQAYNLGVTSGTEKLIEAPVHRQQERDSAKPYARTGYVDLGRPVDDILKKFLKALGDYPYLPITWHNNSSFTYRYRGLGPITLSAAESYHAVFLNGETVVRLYTNAKHMATIDLHKDLVVDFIDWSTLKEIPKGSLKKAKPCTHRITFYPTTPYEEIKKAADLINKYMKRVMNGVQR